MHRETAEGWCRHGALKWQSTYLDIGTVSGHYCWLHTPRHGNSVIMALSDRGEEYSDVKKTNFVQKSGQNSRILEQLLFDRAESHVWVCVEHSAQMSVTRDTWCTGDMTRDTCEHWRADTCLDWRALLWRLHCLLVSPRLSLLLVTAGWCYMGPLVSRHSYADTLHL